MKQLVLAFLVTQLVADDVLKDRPAFSLGDQPAQSSAQCDDIRKMSAGLARPDYRIDLTITGELTTVRGDGALWYLLMCRDVRVLCVTYESNDMKAGDLQPARRQPHHARPLPCQSALKSLPAIPTIHAQHSPDTDVG